jgi:hypothetical protein
VANVVAVVVIEAARDALLVCTDDDNAVTLDAREDEAVASVWFVTVNEAARDALLV